MAPVDENTKVSASSGKGRGALIGENPGTGDVYATGQRSGTGLFDVAVSKTHVYLYNRGNVVIAISRKGGGSKNSNAIK